MQLNKIMASAFYLDGAVNLGLVTAAPDRAVLIDTGLDESVGTHAHADHPLPSAPPAPGRPPPAPARRVRRPVS